MDKITKYELFQKLYNNFNNSSLKITDKEIIDDLEEKNCEPVSFKNIEFINCVFSVEELNFINAIDSNIDNISFTECTFNKEITIEVNKLNLELYFYNISLKKENEIRIEGDINFVNFDNYHLDNYIQDTKPQQNLKGKISIYTNAKNIYIGDIISNNQLFISSENEINSIKITNSSLSKIKISPSRIKKLTITENFNFNCLLDISTFNEGIIYKLNIENNYFSIINIENIIVNNLSSFQNTSVNSIKLDKVQFNDRTYFDDFEILDYKNCERQTIRTIKQELQKTENRIDYDKFRGYELERYKDDLEKKEKWYHGDLLILQLNSLFSKHGTNWKRALGMTFLFSLLFYTFLYGVKRTQHQFGVCQITFDHFMSGYFRFSLITNFSDPIPINNNKYLQTFWEWIPFILGKFIIGYGLYETVQSFRKYKK